MGGGRAERFMEVDGDMDQWRRVDEVCSGEMSSELVYEAWVGRRWPCGRNGRIRASYLTSVEAGAAAKAGS
jgi:hypothetical protein